MMRKALMLSIEAFFKSFQALLSDLFMECFKIFFRYRISYGQTT